MSETKNVPAELTLLGDEAAALGAIHAGLSAAYGYPGTPSTEIMEYLQEEAEKRKGNSGSFTARWCANEKTAMEAALGTSFAGRRAMVTMKHVGLNVASDPFINGALLDIKGGLVVAVADDPGMHSSQGEQDSRYYAFFSLVPCLEPRNQQEAYDMTREAFDLSERFRVPVMLRLVTRLSHARSAVTCTEGRPQNPRAKTEDKTRWMLLPAYARRNYAALIEKQQTLEAWSEEHAEKNLELSGREAPFAVITAGLGGNYYEENLPDLRARWGCTPPRLHIEAYPLPRTSIRRLCESLPQGRAGGKILVIEEGQPLIEEKLRGILPQNVQILGRLEPETPADTTAGPAATEGFAGALPRTGELDPDNVRAALGLPPRKTVLDEGSRGTVAASGETKPPHAPPQGTDLLSRLPGRLPQLCTGCPHGDSYETLNRAVGALDDTPGRPKVSVTSDIGCYSLGASPPYSAIESIVCMGASVGMARGAADAGIPYAFAVIGDSTFIHSGLPALIDAVEANTPMTLIILDNSIVAMTGCQKTAFPSSKLKALILGTGLDPAHCLELEAKKQLIEENAAKLKEEAEYPGLSVVIFKRECLEAARKRLKNKR
ncbi:MAG: indolepyruvate ferredoxin oxidoreductase [Treponema sp.]|jgi:indolepyruvate ferredoxin oxidoreductase alpha subunit|nr:indolepyruvate ferredoxin oxidoreductase [Treponema sp.]